jgi:ribonuclease HIII
MVVFENVKEDDFLKLIKNGFCSTNTKTVHENVRCVKLGVTLILYKSGKLLLQGKGGAVEKVVSELEKLKVGSLVKSESFRQEKGWVIGSDESLKGDTFGGLVVAAVKADDSMREKLRELGVSDSKKLADSEIVRMAEKIKKLVPCDIKSVYPEEYNSYDGNVTSLLDKLHRETANYLFPGKHVVDKYPGCNVGDVAVVRGESKYIEIAAASVLARSAGLAQFNFLSMQAGFELPKGSTHVIVGLEKLKEKGLNFKKFVKIRFKNVIEFLR